MVRSALWISLVFVAGCRMGDTLRPPAVTPAALNISDGAHGASGNPDFFFLSPAIGDPMTSPNWDNDRFNPNVAPTVDICELDAATEAQVADGTPCKPDGYTFTEANVRANGVHYATGWRVPIAPAVFYRITVRVGVIVLGFVDIETAKGAARSAVDGSRFVAIGDGQNLPIRFRIEDFALCDPPGVGPCFSEAIDLAVGGLIIRHHKGVHFPPQGAGQPTVTVTVDNCEPLNPRATDLPVFGACLRITTQPHLPPSGLVNAANVFICNLGPSIVGRVLSEEQEQRITMHRLDEVGAMKQKVAALPHSPGCPVHEHESTAGVTLKGILGDLAHGRFGAAGKNVASMLGPKPLFAARRIDQGAGGMTMWFSDFQFALPSKIEKVALTDGQTARRATLLPLDPAVLVTDVGGDPVMGARVHFEARDGSVVPSSYVTGPDGLAHAAWVLGQRKGTNTLVASGRGIAGADRNGPRDGVDPFQPIQSPFDPAPAGEPREVTVLVGSQTFTAIGTTGAGPGGFAFGFSLGKLGVLVK